MINSRLLIAAMADKCRTLLQAEKIGEALPEAIRPNHLLWMCERIEYFADDWPETKLHRWIGFIQCGILANRVIDLAGVKRMFDEVKNAYAESGEDRDYVDHLDPGNPFTVDIGGEG